MVKPKYVGRDSHGYTIYCNAGERAKPPGCDGFEQGQKRVKRGCKELYQRNGHVTLRRGHRPEFSPSGGWYTTNVIDCR